MAFTSTGTSAIERLTQLAAARPLQVAAEQFYFLRHGQTARNAARIFQEPGEPLDGTGLRQAREAAALLAPVRLSCIACSDMLRAVQTAHAVAQPHGLIPQEMAALRERHFGALIGTSSAAIDWGCAPEGGETLEAFVTRASDGLARALALAAPVLVVAHGGTLHVLAGLLRLNLVPTLLANALPLQFTRHAAGWRVTALGHGGGAAHLA